MSSFFDQLEAQLRSAAQAHASKTGSGPAAAPRPRRWLRAVPVLASVAVVVAVVGGALALLGHGGHGTGTPASSAPHWIRRTAVRN